MLSLTDPGLPPESTSCDTIPNLDGLSVAMPFCRSKSGKGFGESAENQ